jgi:uncharacterized protein YihD (DUF1040 family)
MKNIEKLSNKLEKVKAKYTIDQTDIYILGLLSQKWDKGEDVRVTELTLKFGKGVGSPANLHYRITKDLVKLQLVRLKSSEEDARVKYVVKGKQFDALNKFLGE